MTKPFIAPHAEDATLVLAPAPNGGWFVRAIDSVTGAATLLGAFSTKGEMLEALCDGQPVPCAARAVQFCDIQGMDLRYIDMLAALKKILCDAKSTKVGGLRILDDIREIAEKAIVAATDIKVP